MNIEQANGIPMSVILKNLGVTLDKEKPHEDWYLSPFRKERTASFKVCKKTNKWYDHGEGLGGDVVNFACAFLTHTKQDSTPHDALRWIKIMSGSAAGIVPVFIPSDSNEDGKIHAYSIEDVSKIRLINYLASRGISLAVAREYLCQVNLRNGNTGKSFYALGFKNEKGGYELRNRIFKGGLKPKSISFIRPNLEGKMKTLHMFEGFMDFLTIKEIQPDRFKEADTIVLNSVSNLHRATPYIDNFGYSTIHSWMDNNPAGEKAKDNLAAFIKTQESLLLKPMNDVYAGHEDVNAWHMHNLGL